MPARDYSSISPSARSLLLVKAQTDLPYAREAAAILFGEDALEAARRETASTPGAQLRLRHFEARARSIDSALGALGATRVLEIASGLSLRGLAMAERAGVFYVDTDLPALAAAKVDLVAHLHPEPLAGTLRIEALDALDTNAFASTLREVPPGPLAVVQEGLLMYLDADEKARLAANIRQALLSRGGAWVTADVYVRSATGVAPYRDARTKAFVEKHNVDENKFESFATAEAYFVEQGFAVGKRVSPAADDPWGVRETWLLLPVP
jgi:O-methyltransferase involved in polyketide biosynthesis